jgi:NAD(P)H-hydrate epimerase
VARKVAHLAEFVQGEPLVQIFAGKGNNGGDAFVVAYCLQEMGCDVELFFAGDSSQVQGDGLVHLRKMMDAGIELRELATVDEWERLAAMPHLAGDILVDGLLGTGISGAARGVVAAAIRTINLFSRRARVVAIDIPSGLDGDTGVADGDVVQADLTVTMAMPKKGLLQPGAINLVGNLDVVDIGIPEQLTESIESDLELIVTSEVEGLFGRRVRDTHKGTYGHLLLIGGSPGYSGAIAMAAMAALHSGVGLVSLLVPERISSIVAGLLPEAMVHSGACNENGCLSAASLESIGSRLDDFSAIVIGPGMSEFPESSDVLQQLLNRTSCPVVIDAGALNLVAKYKVDLQERRNLILTPHPGEMARLLECSPAEIQQNRFSAASKAALVFGGIVVLKGAGSVVTQPGQGMYVNMSGNPGMATGGSGDVLSGLTGGLVAGGLDVFDAVKAAVHLHGLAGDQAALMTSQISLTATGMIASLPKIFRQVSGI